MIASKQIAFGRGSKRKPYDAEIEYLESTGTQYIDLGFLQDKQYRAEMDVSIPFSSITGNCVICGANQSTSIGSYLSAYSGATNYIQMFVAEGSSARIPANDSQTKITIDAAAGMLSGYGSTAVLGKINVSSIINYMIFASRAPTRSSAGTRFYSFKYESDLHSVDLIPVRKGNVGYMYDRVSGQLFGNQGTGEFVLGKDVGDDVDYTAKDYIQDGLVAMWDGIENAGWGVHDNEATNWTELITNTNSAAFDNAFKWEADCLNTKGGTRTSSALAPSNIMADRVPGTSYTIEVAVKDYVSADSVRVIFSPSSSPQISVSTYRRDGFEQIAFTFNGNNYYYYGNGSSSVVEGSHTFTMVCDGKTPKVYIDGVYVAPQAGGSIGTFSPNAGSLPYFAWHNPALHSEKYCRISCYKSALTAEEVTHNYKIDKQRFGL